MDEEYLKRVWQALTKGPTQQDLPFLIEAYTKVGYLLAEAKSDAADAATVRKHEEAQEWIKAKQTVPEGGKPVSDTIADKIALVATFSLRRNEVAAERKAVKLSHLRESVYQAISVIKNQGVVWGEA